MRYGIKDYEVTFNPPDEGSDPKHGEVIMKHPGKTPYKGDYSINKDGSIGMAVYRGEHDAMAFNGKPYCEEGVSIPYRIVGSGASSSVDLSPVA